MWVVGFKSTFLRLADSGFTICMLFKLFSDGYFLGSFPSVSRIRGTGELDTCWTGLDGLRCFVVL